MDRKGVRLGTVGARETSARSPSHQTRGTSPSRSADAVRAVRPVGDGHRARCDEPRHRDTRRANATRSGRRTVARSSSSRGVTRSRLAAQGPPGERPRGVLATPRTRTSRRTGPRPENAPLLRLAQRAQGRAERLGLAAGRRRAGAVTGFRVVTSRNCRPTGAGLPTSRASPARTKCTSSPSAARRSRARLRDGGGQPKWRGDGRELFFTTPANRLMAVAVRASGERLDASLPTELFEIRGSPGQGLRRLRAERRWPALPGQGPHRAGEHAELHVVTNWTSLLR